MRVCIVLMFVTVLVTAALLVEDWAEVAMGMVVPNIPDAGGEGITATIALIGGVGGTLTVVCYSYWIRETGQDGPSDLNTCRADLCVGYGVTALFGVAMVILGSGIEIEGSGAGLIVALANHLEGPLGSFAKWMFLTGAFGAVFSSLLGVWQSVPYLFADFCAILSRSKGSPRPGVDTAGRPYRTYLYAIALVPMVGLWIPFKEIQQFYAVLGALFFPMLAVTLLWLNEREDWVGRAFKNGWKSRATLLFTLVFFVGLETQRWLS